METYKLIRKICLTLSALVGVFLYGYILFEDWYWYRLGNLNDDVVAMSMLAIGQFIGVYIFFEFLAKLMESVKEDKTNLKLFSDKKYLEAYSEVEENNIQNKELWAKAFAQCGGDKEKQKSIYVELRTKELSKG